MGCFCLGGIRELARHPRTCLLPPRCTDPATTAHWMGHGDGAHRGTTCTRCPRSRRRRARATARTTNGRGYDWGGHPQYVCSRVNYYSSGMGVRADAQKVTTCIFFCQRTRPLARALIELRSGSEGDHGNTMVRNCGPLKPPLCRGNATGRSREASGTAPRASARPRRQ